MRESHRCEGVAKDRKAERLCIYGCLLDCCSSWGLVGLRSYQAHSFVQQLVQKSHAAKWARVQRNEIGLPSGIMRNAENDARRIVVGNAPIDVLLDRLQIETATVPGETGNFTVPVNGCGFAIATNILSGYFQPCHFLAGCG